MSNLKPANILRTITIAFIVLAVSTVYSCTCNSPTNKTDQADTSSATMSDSSKMMNDTPGMRMDTTSNPEDTTKGDQTGPPKKP